MDVRNPAPVGMDETLDTRINNPPTAPAVVVFVHSLLSIPRAARESRWQLPNMDPW